MSSGEDPVFLNAKRPGGTAKPIQLRVDDSLVLKKHANFMTLSVAGGSIHVKDPVRLRTDSALPDYDVINYGTALESILVGKKTGTLIVDGTRVAVNDRILVTECENACDNGVYVVIIVGDINVPWRLQRDGHDVSCGAHYFVEYGASQSGSAWVLASINPINVGKTRLVYKKQYGILPETGSNNVVLGKTQPGSVPIYTSDTITPGFRSIVSGSPGLVVSAGENGETISIGLNEREISVAKLKGFEHNNYKLDDREVGKNIVWSSDVIKRNFDKCSQVSHTHKYSDVTGLDDMINNRISVALDPERIGSKIHVKDLQGIESVGSGKIINNVERTKLSGIEFGATADQTADEIKILYEQNADTNCYTDEHKLFVSQICKLPVESIGTNSLSQKKLKTLYENNENTNCYTDTDKQHLQYLIAHRNDDYDPKKILNAFVANRNVKLLTTDEKTLLSKTSGTNTGDELPASNARFGTVRIASDAEIMSGECNNAAVTPKTLRIGKPGGAASLDQRTGKLLEDQMPVFSHSYLRDQSFDDHKQYLHMNGRPGDQIVYGSNSHSGNLVLRSTRNENWGRVFLPEGTDSTDVTNGAFVVAGGAGIGMNCCVGKDLNVTGTANFNGDINIRGNLNGIDVKKLLLEFKNKTTGSRLYHLEDKEICQLENINDTNISVLNWKRLSELDQVISTTARVTFYELTARIMTPNQPLINHGSLSGLNDDSHPNYVCNQGRGSQQIIHGGTDAGGTLHLKGTTNSTAGMVVVADLADSTADTNGALHIKGGMSAKKSGYFGGGLHARKYYGAYASTDIRSARSNQVPPNTACLELNSNPETTVADFSLMGPKDPVPGEQIMIYNDTNYKCSGDFELDSRQGAHFFYNGIVWRKC